MDGTSNRALERAAELIEQEAAVSVAAASAALEATGRLECVDCGTEISVARRQALPSAKRCIDCQSIAERGGR